MSEVSVEALNGGDESRRCVADPGRIADLVEEMRVGQSSAQGLVTRYLARIDAVDPAVQAWRLVDRERALHDARVLDEELARGQPRGPLHGVPVAVKDVIDVAGLPTRCNSRALEANGAVTADAQVVTALRAAGALVLGKAHTTEYAFFDPSPACNPWNTEHTPGGSSSGSAAAVAAGMVPAALGTQTVASVNRPAAYCGIAAFKPSTGLLSTHGVTPLAPMFDTVGFFGFRVADAVDLFEAVLPAYAGAPSVRSEGDGSTPRRVVVLRDAQTGDAATCVVDALQAAAQRLRDAGHALTERDSPVAFETVCAQQMRCALYEMGRVHRALLDLPTDQVGAKLRAAVDEGSRIADAEYYALRRSLAAAREDLFQALIGTDAVLWPAAPDTAPKGLAWTGDPRYISPWTALGGPVVTVRVGEDDGGLPVGALLAGRPGSDAQFTATARHMARALEVRHP